MEKNVVYAAIAMDTQFGSTTMALYDTEHEARKHAAGSFEKELSSLREYESIGGCHVTYVDADSLCIRYTVGLRNDKEYLAAFTVKEMEVKTEFGGV